MAGVFRSIRFRLAATYTVVVFTLAALVVGTVYVIFSQTLDPDALEGLEPRRVSSERGVAIFIDEGAVESFEVLVAEESLIRLRQTSLIALAVLLPASFLAGWIISGRALRPVGQIAGVAREIQAGDLSRRIELAGPDDELKRLGDTFDDMLERIEQGVEDQRRFVQDTSHELRNPLATMSLNLDVALDDEDATEEELRDTLRVLRRGVDRLSSTVDDLMRFARRELPRSEAVLVELSSLADEVATEFRVPAATRSVTIELMAGPAPVRTDAEAIHAAVANLAANAVRMAPAGSTVVFGSGVTEGWSWVGVHDDGPGIEEETHRLVFQRNWGADGTRLSDEPRAGLGLAIVRQVAEAGGGRVTLQSEPGTGSSFVIWLPQAEDADPEVVTHDGIHPVKDPFANL
jgi:signal transduction histidine kinase